MNRFDSKAFRSSLFYKIPQWLWASGFIVASPGQLLASFVFHNPIEAKILFIAGMAMMLPFLAVGLWLLYKGRQELRRLETELIVYETLLKLADPQEYERMQTKREVERLFKK